MNLGIQGKRALVIGGTSGLGLACCQSLAAEGVDLAIFARNSETLKRTRSDLTDEFAVRVDTYSGDVTNRADIVSTVELLRDSGGIDILVLNTPRPPSPMRDFLAEDDDSRWEQAYRDQLHGALNVLREATPLLTTKGWGRIIGITSASVKEPLPRHAISSVFRAGVQAALKHLASEIAQFGVTVNSVAPATIATPTFEQFHDLESRVRLTPLGRSGTPEELGATVAFLASYQAGFITGQLIQLDGGRTASLV
ncbi:SDR family oxidoreductase [Rhodococcus sp. NPDC059968]|uniref:SDR family oxidoreductase n=1 Tax=Rhodococcus sp. NPDC059968 TaxID=3347017 RepID=UPI00366E6E2B